MMSFLIKIRVLVTTLMIALLVPQNMVRAQELEYALELGAMAGGSFYLGDANYSGWYKHLGGTIGATARWNINPRMALKFNASYAGISGDINDTDNKFPTIEKAKFSEPLFDVGCQYELHFWGYGTGTATYKGHKRWTPYIQLGLGGTYCNDTFTMNLPIGFGIKYKIKERLNVGFDWTMRFSLSDKLDGIEDPYAIKSGFLKNKDSYCLTTFYVTYDLCPKLRKCASNL